MEDAPDSPAIIEIRAVGRTASVTWPIRVFVDGEQVGALMSKRARSFSVLPGVRQVSVKYGSQRSKTLDLCLSSGECAELECGFDNRLGYRSLAGTALFWATVAPLMIRGLPLTGLAAALLVGAALGVDSWKVSRTPGSSLYLRPRTIPTTAKAKASAVLPMPRLTIRWCMVAVAVVAVLLAVGVLERRSQRRLNNQRQAGLHRSLAEMDAESEKRWSDSVKRLADREQRNLRYVDTLEKGMSLGIKDPSLQSKLKDAKRDLELTRQMKDEETKLAAYYAQLKKKHLYAASHPWEPVDPDPPPP